MTDFQRERVYDWEKEALGMYRNQWPVLDLVECRNIIDAVYPVSPPNLEDGRGRRRACGDRRTIILPKWTRMLPTVLHECAHGLAGNDRGGSHRPRFVATYIDLLDRYAPVMGTAERTRRLAG